MFRKILQMWKLKESEVKEVFAKKINKSCDGNEGWSVLKRKLLDVARKVCLFNIWKQIQKEEDKKALQGKEKMLKELF